MALVECFFVIPGAFDEAWFSGGLKGLDPRFEDAKPAQGFEILDCHDQSLRASGKVLIESGGTLRLLHAGEPVTQRCKGKGKFAQDLPKGPVRDGLAGFPKLRALMSMGAGQLENRSFAILDDLQKTQVRGSMMTLSSDYGQVSLVAVQPMRGYDRSFQAVCGKFDEMAAGATGTEPLFQALFPNLVVYKAKPQISIGTQEPSIEVATDIIRTYLAVARQNEAGVLADIDTEFLHDYRVSLRRVRSVISLFKGVFSPDQTTALKREFSDLMAPTGRVRDLDVYLLEKDDYFDLIPPNLHEGAKAMFAQFEKERAQALSSLSRRFRTASYDQQMNDLAALFSDHGNLQPGENADRAAYEYACALIWKRYRKVCKLARRITPDTPDDDVHELRIDCKKLRYLMEFFAPLFNAKAFKTIIKPLKKLQDNLGLFNDFSVQQEALLRFVAQQSNNQGRANAQIAMSVGGLIAVLNQRQRTERDRVVANFQHFDSPEIRHLFRSLFHKKEG
ncbi:CHAD domain-containing protein [Ruegeria sp. Ofav3-42]|uniref:CHAD domain-containing protein n=1 Tax=Ruegeria sp. Ofav3-42 TaxID=2917759 RepID=UPI001EF52E0B|nr:CHAD domain-containing protein [Ruegeria sp. Ofav3-42]MCG7519543.1 CHAD domain-containing protein [Ruegeria sp. Ofav3-42]